MSRYLPLTPYDSINIEMHRLFYCGEPHLTYEQLSKIYHYSQSAVKMRIRCVAKANRNGDVNAH